MTLLQKMHDIFRELKKGQCGCNTENDEEVLRDEAERKISMQLHKTLLFLTETNVKSLKDLKVKKWKVT